MKLIISLSLVLLFVFNCASEKKSFVSANDDTTEIALDSDTLLNSLEVKDKETSPTLDSSSKDIIQPKYSIVPIDTVHYDSVGVIDTLIDTSIVKLSLEEIAARLSTRLVSLGYVYRNGENGYGKEVSTIANDSLYVNSDFKFSIRMYTSFDTTGLGDLANDDDALELSFDINKIGEDFVIENSSYSSSYLQKNYAGYNYFNFDFQTAGEYQFAWTTTLNGVFVATDTLTVICQNIDLFTAGMKYYNVQHYSDAIMGQLDVSLWYHKAIPYEGLRTFQVQVLDGKEVVYDFKQDSEKNIDYIITPLLDINKEYIVIKKVYFDADSIVCTDTTSSEFQTRAQEYGIEGFALFRLGEVFGKSYYLNSFANSFLYQQASVLEKDTYPELFNYNFYVETSILGHRIPDTLGLTNQFRSKDQLYKSQYGAYFEYDNSSFSSGEFQNTGFNVTATLNSSGQYRHKMVVDFSSDRFQDDYYYGCGSYITYQNVYHDLSACTDIAFDVKGVGTYRLVFLGKDGMKYYQKFTIDSTDTYAALSLKEFIREDATTAPTGFLQECSGIVIEAHKVDNVDKEVYISSSNLTLLHESEFQIVSPTNFGYYNEIAIDNDEPVVCKPIIYLYPKDTTEINVQLDIQGTFAYTYPTYTKGGWKVIASPDGSLIEKETNRKFYSLFWDATGKVDTDDETGFVVASDNLETFFEDKLTKLGLNYKEKQEFIIFWTPILKRNPFNFIHFSIEEYKKWAKMEVSPKPDSEIRFLMLYKAEDKNYKAQEQKIITPKRDGFVLVEWGGSQIGSQSIK